MKIIIFFLQLLRLYSLEPFDLRLERHVCLRQLRYPLLQKLQLLLVQALLLLLCWLCSIMQKYVDLRRKNIHSISGNSDEPLISILSQFTFNIT